MVMVKSNPASRNKICDASEHEPGDIHRLGFVGILSVAWWLSGSGDIDSSASCCEYCCITKWRCCSYLSFKVGLLWIIRLFLVK